VAWLNNFNDAPANTNGNANFCVQSFSSATFNTCPINVTGAIVGSTTITAGATSNKVLSGRTSSSGTTLVSGDWAGGGNWGTGGATFTTNNNATDDVFSVTVTAGSGSPGANPTATLTFHDGTWGLTGPQCMGWRNDATSPLPTSAYWYVSAISSTSVTFTFAGTPSASNAYGLIGFCRGHN
jgi:hypothetical protein